MTPHQWFLGGIITLTLAGIAIGRYPGLRMNRATISIVGAALLVLAGGLSREEAYRAIDFDTITLLFAMMVINANLHVAGFFQWVAVWVIRLAKTPRQLLVLVVFASGILSALFLNDTICIVFTPLIIDITLALRRNPLPYLMAVATAANAGSAATIIGNPQNMLIGISSQIPFAQFTGALLPVSLGSMIIIMGILLLVYRRELTSERLSIGGVAEPQIYRPLFVKSIIASLVMIALCLANYPVALSAMAAASILLITRRLKPQRVFGEIDWSLLVFFSGLFIITAAITRSGLSGFLFHAAAPLNNGGTASLAASSAVLSNLVSNVPAVLLFQPIMGSLQNPAHAWLVLAMASTLAGNLTLLGSVANLIVAESARHRGINLSFTEYLKAGLAIALLTLLWGVLWLR